MIPPVVLAPKEGEIILDMAAAPGSKTTQMAQMMKNTGIIVANEKHFERLFSLRANLQRCMITNTIVTQMDGRDFEKSELKFDKILVDAPCSEL
jgi:16S rRNA C967 or C1407 C5-methylase (RsmB/RsmF family)